MLGFIFKRLGEILKDLDPEIDFTDTDDTDGTKLEATKLNRPRINWVDRLTIPVR